MIPLIIGAVALIAGAIAISENEKKKQNYKYKTVFLIKNSPTEKTKFYETESEADKDFEELKKENRFVSLLKKETNNSIKKGQYEEWKEIKFDKGI